MKTPGPRITNSPTSPFVNISPSESRIRISNPGNPIPAVVKIFSEGELLKDVVSPPSVIPQRRVTKVFGNSFSTLSIKV